MVAAKYNGDHVIGFGKYKGSSLDEIADQDPGYIVWLSEEGVMNIENSFVVACEMEVREVEEEHFGDRD